MARYETDGSSALAPNDPYNEMDRSDIRPSLKIIEGGKSKNSSGGARDNLTRSERSAVASPLSVIEGGIGKAKGAEQNQPYAPRFVGKGLSSKGDGKNKGRDFLKKRGPLAAIMALLLGGGVLMAGSQSLMPFSLISQFKETFDSIKTSQELRSNAFLRHQLNPNRVKNPLRATMFGSLKFKITTRQETKLKKQGITVDRGFEYTDARGRSRTITVLRFDDGSGFEPMVIAPNRAIAEQIDASGRFSTVHSFDSAFSEIHDFRNGYIKGSLTWRGSVKAWFDTITVKFLQSNRLTRNRFKNFQERVQAENDGNTRSAAIEMMRSDIDNENSVSARNTDGTVTDEEVDNGDGTTSSEKVGHARAENGGGVKARIDAAIYRGNKAQIEAYLKDFGDGMSSKATGIASATVNIACTVFNFVGAVNLMLVAHEAEQIMRLVTGYFEAIQKVQSGDGADSPLNDLANGLTIGADTTDDDGNVIRTNTSSMASNGVSSIYGNKAINQDDPSVSSFNIGKRLNSILGYLGASVASFLGCSIARASAAAVGLVLDIVKIATCAATFGVGCVVSAIADAGGSVASGIAINEAISTASAILAPILYKAFSRDIITNLAGEDLGNALVSGANMYMGTNHRSGGGALTDSSGLTQFIAAQQQVIANEARYERETLSPFDLSSKYTFFGSIANQIVTFSAQTTSISGFVASMGNVLGNSISSMLPSASAMHATTTVTSTGYCPDLESIGAVGDAFCNPYIVTDVSTLDGESNDPAEVVNRVDARGNLLDEKDGVPVIKGNSNLAKYIVFCSERGSPFGVADQNIVNEVSNWGSVNSDSAELNTTANATIGAIPVVGDAIDIIANAVAVDNYGWVSGESCVQGNNVAAISSPNWEETKDYQRFVEDQRLAEGMGLVEKSAVTAFLEDYYAEHPLDESYEGILARKTGLTKETVIATLDQLDYYKFLADYDPTELGPTPDYSESDYDEVENSAWDIVVAYHGDTPKIEYAVYYDVRNRSYTV